MTLGKMPLIGEPFRRVGVEERFRETTGSRVERISVPSGNS